MLFKILLAESISNGEVFEIDDEKSDYVDDDRALDTDDSLFSTQLITELSLSTEPHERVKRVLVFRPLFVYRQEQIKRKRIIEKRKQRSQKANNKNLPAESQTLKPCNCCSRCPRY